MDSGKDIGKVELVVEALKLIRQYYLRNHVRQQSKPPMRPFIRKNEDLRMNN
jgi:hypothetical protein